MRRTGICILLAVFTLCEWSDRTAAGWARPPAGHASHGPRLERLVEELGLDAQTLAQVEAILDASRDKKRTLRRQLRAARQQMHSLLEAEEPQEAELLEQADLIGGLRTELRKEQLKAMLRVRALLSPEQRAKLLERLNQVSRRGRHGFDRHQAFPSAPSPHEAP